MVGCDCLIILFVLLDEMSVDIVMILWKLVLGVWVDIFEGLISEVDMCWGLNENVMVIEKLVEGICVFNKDY